MSLGGGGERLIQAWGSKLRGALVRMATLCHMAEAVDSVSDPFGQVSKATMQRVMGLADYLIAHALAAHHVMGADAAQRDAALIVRALRRAWAPVTDGREILRRCRGLDAERRDAAVRVLVDRGYLRALPSEETRRGGRPEAPRYEVTPFLRDETDRKDQTCVLSHGSVLSDGAEAFDGVEREGHDDARA